MSSRADQRLEALRDAMHQEWRREAACAGARLPDGSPADFVDVDSAEAAEYLIRRFCHHCAVVCPCSAEAARLAPHAWNTVMGARLWCKGQRT